MMKRRFLTAALGITMALSLAACGSQTNTQNSSTAESSSSTASSAEAQTSTESGTTESQASASTETTEKEASDGADSSVAGDTENNDNTGNTDNTASIANPFVEVSSLEEAAKLTGFTLTVPETPADYPDMTVQVMDNSMIEVIFENKANETEYAIDEDYRIRKEAGSDDISGDYNEYSDVHTEKIDGMDVTVKGDGETISVATWTNDGYSYAVDAEDHPMTLAEMTEVVKAVK